MIWVAIAFIAGTIVGFLAAAMISAGNKADEYEPVEHDPEPRVMPKIWDGFNRKEPT